MTHPLDQYREAVARALAQADGITICSDAIYRLSSYGHRADAAIRAMMPAFGDTYRAFTDGMEAAAQICGSLAETTYDDADAFEAATGCEAEIMRVVREQRREQAAATSAPTEGRE